jgi:hypothetical protein
MRESGEVDCEDESQQILLRRLVVHQDSYQSARALRKAFDNDT